MNTQSKSDSYAAAGVDITAGYKAVELMKTHIAKTLTSGVCSDVGGFGGLFELDLEGITKPVLVSGTDGVGTKLKLAFLMDKHDTVGIDCVAMCVNDIICCGAKPLFFLEDAMKFRQALPDMTFIYVGGVISREGAEKVLDCGFPLFQMGRAVLEDPDFVNKMKETDGEYCNGCKHSNNSQNCKNKH